MTDPTYTQLRAYHRCVNAMLDDPEVTGDLLLIGLWMARAVHLKIPEPTDGNWAWKAMCVDIYGAAQAHHGHSLKRALRDDLPRYDPYRDGAVNALLMYVPCAAPMIRRPGPCGKDTVHHHLLTDVSTGRRVQVGACTRHRSWLDAKLLENRDEVRAAGDSIPKPAPNCGGALARHIPRGIGWRKLYRSLDPKWAPPVGEPVRRPRLEVLTFEPDADDLAEAAGAERPVLSVIRGGWR